MSIWVTKTGIGIVLASGITVGSAVTHMVSQTGDMTARTDAVGQDVQQMKINAEEYQDIIGDRDALIKQIETDANAIIDQKNTAITTKDQEIANLQGQIDSLNAEITSLENASTSEEEVAQLAKNIDALEAEIVEIENQTSDVQPVESGSIKWGAPTVNLNE